MDNTRRTEISPWLLLFTSLVGGIAFLYPFFLPAASGDEEAAHGADAPLIFVLLVGLCLLVLLADLETRRLDARQVALLGVLVATNAALRPLPGPSGFSAIFVLPILGGYVFGGGFGFLLGALSMLVSALFTAGVGPWLPFEMYGLGWVGLSAAWLPRILDYGFSIFDSAQHTLRRSGAQAMGDIEPPKSKTQNPKSGERWLLAGWGLIVGLAYGALLNLWFWPFQAPAFAGDPAAWDPATGLAGALTRYAAFYAVTSLPTDVVRGLGNVLLLGLLAAPLLKLFRRVHERFTFTVVPGE